MREIVHIQAGQCGNQIGSKSSTSGSRTWYHGLGTRRTIWTVVSSG
ncbi:unnamed protein product [Haemonchus placei]|uniref:Tubulin domain-containing protein n=1 Tax=Haemonchus placei TaxID=6290 RepID=A0A0N4X3Q6_HAEPC|nr:unnamed protein product [Haemonchus placei]